MCAHEPSRACLLLALASAAILLGALELQYLGGQPRLPAVHPAALAYLALICSAASAGAPARARCWACPPSCVLVGAGLAAYHVGIEQGWWAVPAGCVAGGGAEASRS